MQIPYRKCAQCAQTFRHLKYLVLRRTPNRPTDTISYYDAKRFVLVDSDRSQVTVQLS